MKKFAKFEVVEGIVKPLLAYDLEYKQYIHIRYSSKKEAINSIEKYENGILILPVYNSCI